MVPIEGRVSGLSKCKEQDVTNPIKRPNNDDYAGHDSDFPVGSLMII